MYIQHPDAAAHLDATTKTVWNPLRLPISLQTAFDVRADIIGLATQHGEIEKGEDFVSLFTVLKSGIILVYEIPRQEVETPFAFDFNKSGAPQLASVWANGEPVFAMAWNWRGVFQLERFEKGSWQKQLRRALARPDLHII